MRWLLSGVRDRLFCGRLVVVAALWLVGCGDPTPPEAPPPASKTLLPSEDPDQAVALVNGQPISAARLDAAHRRAPPHTSRAQTLRALIDLELLTQEAAREGLDLLPQALDRKERLVIQRLLERAIEHPISQETLPPDLPEQVYNSFSLDIFEPELVTASHVLIELPADAQTPERLSAAQAFAHQLRAQILSRAPNPTPDDLTAVAALSNLSAWTVRAEHNLSFPAHPIKPLPGASPRFPAVVQPFADAAFALAPLNPLSQPVVTSFGVHLILRTDRRPDLRPAFEAARNDIAQKLITAQRRTSTQQLIQRLSTQTPIQLDDAPLNALADRLFGPHQTPPTPP